MEELQNVWNWSAAMDLKQQNRNALRLTFVFEHVNKYTMETRSKTNVFEWYNLYRNSSGEKKIKELQCPVIIFCLNT